MSFFDPIYILSILFALTLHEWSHAFVATRLGDPTPGAEGRLTVNPLAHLDPLGALLFLTVGFGWAKPVPINPGYFRSQKTGVLLTAIAGPLSNFILAFLAFGLLFFLTGQSTIDSVWGLLSARVQGSIGMTFMIRFLSSFLFVNLGLMAFNLLPIAPLDGSKVLEAFIPLRYQEAYENYMRYGPYILLALLIGENLLGFSLLSGWIMGIMQGVLRGFGTVFH